MSRRAIQWMISNSLRFGSTISQALDEEDGIGAPRQLFAALRLQVLAALSLNQSVRSGTASVTTANR